MKPFLILLLFFSVPVFAEKAQDSAPDDFAAHFHDDANVLLYIQAVDKLLSSSLERKYDSIGDMASDARPPQITTANGIHMVFTVAKVENGMQLHLSASRAKYLARPFGKHIVGLFMVRAGLEKPSSFMISPNQVFHADWTLDDDRFGQFAKTVSELAAKDVQDPGSFFVQALIKAGTLR